MAVEHESCFYRCNREARTQSGWQPHHLQAMLTKYRCSFFLATAWDQGSTQNPELRREYHGVSFGRHSQLGERASCLSSCCSKVLRLVVNEQHRSISEEKAKGMIRARREAGCHPRRGLGESPQASP